MFMIIQRQQLRFRASISSCLEYLELNEEARLQSGLRCFLSFSLFLTALNSKQEDISHLCNVMGIENTFIVH